MRLLLLSFAIAFASCALRLPAPEVSLPDNYRYGNSLPDTISLEGEWWHIYGDSLLDSLQRVALDHNRDLRSALSRVMEAHYNIAASRSALLPSFSAEIMAEGDYTTLTRTSSEFILGGSASWSTAIFGELRYTVGQARAEYLSSEWALRAFRLTLTKEVATAYYTLREAAHSLLIARRSHRLRQEASTLIDSLARYGFSTGLDRLQAESLVNMAAADVAQYERAKEQATVALTTLLGAEVTLSVADSLPMPTLPESVPSGVPSDLLGQRPDVMEAYYTMQAAAAEVGITRSRRLPSISLTASGGKFGTDVKNVFNRGYWSWDTTGTLAQPLFSFGRLRKQEQMARERYLQAVATYEQSVLQALEEVETALIAISSFRTQAERYATYVERNLRIAQLTEALYQTGMSNYLDVISTYQTWYDSQLTLISLTSQQYINYAELVMALGEGWQQME